MLDVHPSGRNPVLHGPSANQAKRFSAFAISTVLLVVLTTEPKAQPNLDSLQNRYYEAISHLTTPELEARKHLLRYHQQRGYAATLSEVLRGDGFMGLIAYIRTRLQIEYSLSHAAAVVDISAKRMHAMQSDSLSFRPRSKPRILLPMIPDQPMTVELNIDWTYPVDPWAKY